jgi:ParB-like chromosome segregation protein Spo0J
LSEAVVIDGPVEMVPIKDLIRYPGNARRGDVDVIAESIKANGFYGVVIRQRSTGYTLAGNHRTDGAELAGLTELPVQTIDVDDATARRINLVDNRSNQLAGYDTVALSELLSLAMDEGSLVGTGFTEDDYADTLVDAEALFASSTDYGKDGEGTFDRDGQRASAGRRQIVLDLELNRFAWLTDALAEIGSQEGVSNNRDVVLRLAERYLGRKCPAPEVSDE